MTVDPGLALIIVAMIQAISIYFQIKNLKGTEKAQGDIKVLRTQTNHMHDAIVAAKEKDAFAAGQEDVRAENSANTDRS